MELDIEKVAALARLNLKEDEKEKLRQDLNAILQYVKKLEELDTRNVIPTSHVLDLENVFRKDEVKESQVRESALSHAPSKEEKFFKVPKVVEKE